MKHHLITSAEPIAETVAKSLCGKTCRVLDRIPSDEDLQAISVNSLATCSKCRVGALKLYVYVGVEQN